MPIRIDGSERILGVSEVARAERIGGPERTPFGTVCPWVTMVSGPRGREAPRV